MNDVILSIAIPTYNRAQWLKLCLTQLLPQVAAVGDDVDVTVYDNASSDNTSEVAQSFIEQGYAFDYVRNTENIGSDRNIAQCFNFAKGHYVLILGDDDVLLDGTLLWLLERLSRQQYGVVCMRPYGYENDFRKEYPGGKGREQTFSDGSDFLAEIGPLVTFISACVINKRLLYKVDAREFCESKLVQMHLVIRAVLAAKQSLFVRRYLLACKRNNSGGYDFSRVFVEEFWHIVDQYSSLGLSGSSIYALEKRMLLGYYPFYLFRQRLAQTGDNESAYAMLKARFGERWLFHLLLSPILRLPRPLGVAWGAGATILGRIAAGDFRRGVMFTRDRLVQMVRR